MDIEIKDKNGITLKTAGKYCSEDVSVIPKLQSKSITANGSVAADDGYVGLDSVTVAVPAPKLQAKTVTPTKSQQSVTPDSSYDGLSAVTVNKIPDNYIVPSGSQSITANGTYDVTSKASVNVAVPNSQPTLNAPSIALSGSTLTITNPSTNGNFVTGYKVYKDGTLLTTITTTTLNLSTLITVAGTYSITVKASGTNFNDSAASSVVNYIRYSITPTLTNITAASGNAMTIATGETKVLTYTAVSGYTLPDTVTVTGATGVWDKNAGTLTLSNPTANVTFTIAGVAAASGYNVTVSGTESNHDFDIYDGQSSSGTNLGTIYGSDSKSVVCTSGYLLLASDLPGGIVSTTGGVTEINDSTVKVTGDGTVVAAYMCLIEGTQITLADGSTKAIEDITYDDELLVWNFYEGKFDTAKPKWIKVEEVTPRYCLVKFSNGAEVGFVGPGEHTRQSDSGRGYHRIFNKEAGVFTYVGTEETPNGTTTFAQDGTFPTVVSQEVVEKEVKFYNVITDKHYNIFANGILTSCRLSNEYKIEDMKYVGERLITEEQIKAYFERIEDKRK